VLFGRDRRPTTVGVTLLICLVAPGLGSGGQGVAVYVRARRPRPASGPGPGGAAAGVVALSWTGQNVGLVGAVVTVVALGLLVPALGGLLTGTFCTVNAYPR
jgi:hypothetical protein